MMIDGIRKFACAQLPETVGDAVALDSTGLPISIQIIFYAIATPLSEYEWLGGAIEVGGFLLRLYLCMLESGFQEWLLKKGYPVDRKSMCHEFICGNLLGWFLAYMKEIRTNVLTCYYTCLTPVQRTNNENGTERVDIGMESSYSMTSVSAVVIGKIPKQTLLSQIPRHPKNVGIGRSIYLISWRRQ